MAEDSAGKVLFLVRRRGPAVEKLTTYCRDQAGLEVAFASDGLQGLRLARAMRPRLVLTEVILPGLDGLSVCKALRGDPATGRASLMMVSILAAEQPAREVGVDAFLRLPVDADRLVDSAARLLRGRPLDPRSECAPPASIGSSRFVAQV